MIALLLAAAAVPATYSALGTEPFWHLAITRRTMRLTRPDAPPLVVRAPRPRPTRTGRRYTAPAMTVEIVRARCSDGMSDRVFPNRVTVRVRGTVLRGCGGTPLTR